MRVRNCILALVLAVGCSAETRADEREDLGKTIDSVLEVSRRDYSTMSLDSLKRFAESGVAEAQFYLGGRYLEGTAGVRDSVEGLRWIRKAAERDDVYAQEFMAALFYNGVLVSVDSDSAFYWIHRAARLDYGVCQARMAIYCWQTARTAVDSITGYMWSRLAKFNWDIEADRKVCDSISADFASHLSPDQVSTGDAQVITWLERRLGESKNGQDSTRTIRNLSKAGSPEGMFKQAKMDYLYGSASDSTMRKGLALVAKAALSGYGPAAFEIGEKYNWGNRPVTQNLDSAAYWLTKGVEAGDANAQMSLGYMYRVGRGVKKNVKESLRLLKLSAAQYNRMGICELGNFYWSDEAPKKNKVRAWALLNVAKERAVQVSVVTIGEIIRKMNDKERAEAEQLRKDLGDKTKIRAIVESWVD